MQYKWELGIEDLNVCKNGEFMSANDNTNDAPYWKQRSVFVAPFTSSNSWFFDSQFISGTGYQYINRAFHVLNNALANVDLDLYQEGRIKIGRSYTVTVVYHITAIGTAPAYGLQIRTGGTVVQTRPATATANPVTYSYTTSGPATTEEFFLQTNTRVTIDIYSVKVEEIFAFQEFEEPIDWVSSGKITLERSSKYKGVFRKFIHKATFAGSAFEFIEDIDTRIGDDGFVKLKLYYRCDNADSWTILLNGILFLQDAEFACNSVSVNIEGDNFSDRILRYEELGVSTSSPISVEGSALPAVVAYTTDQYLSPTVSRKVYFVYDVFEAIVKAVTNENITIDAPIFEHVAFAASTGQYGFSTISSGTMLRGGASGFNITLSDLFKNIDNIFNLYSYVYESGGSYFFKIDDIANAYSGSKITLTNDLYGINNITRIIYDEARYTGINIGYAEYDGTQESKPAIQIRFTSIFANGNVLDKTCNFIQSKYLAQTQSAATSNDNDENIYLCAVDTAATSPLNSEGAAFANYNDSITTAAIYRWQTKKRYEADWGKSPKRYNRGSKLKRIHNFSAPLPLPDFLTIEQSANTDYIEFSKAATPTAAQKIEGYVQQMTWDVARGVCEFRLLEFEDLP